MGDPIGNQFILLCVCELEWLPTRGAVFMDNYKSEGSPVPCCLDNISPEVKHSGSGFLPKGQ